MNQKLLKGNQSVTGIPIASLQIKLNQSLFLFSTTLCLHSISPALPSFQRHNFVSKQCIFTKLSRLKQEIMLRKALSEFPQLVLPLPCNVCISVTSL